MVTMEYTKRLAIAEKVEKSKERLKDPMGKQRSHITNLLLKTSWDKNLFLCRGSMLIYSRWSLYIAQTMLGRTGFQLHSLVMQYTNQSHLKAETTVSDLLDSSPLLAVLKCLEDKVKHGRLHKAFLRWFTEKQKKGITFSYGFTRLESKYFCWHFVSLI